MADFDYFVIFAEMRTGSNFLEANLNAFDGVHCYGEAFNPHFIGYPNSNDVLGVTQAVRDSGPTVLIDAIKQSPEGLGGFRYFHDHDPRVLDPVIEDPRCAKVVLTRNPLDSYVSWKIAQATGQWKLTDAKSRKDGKARFDADEFEAHVNALQAFQVTLLNRLQVLGQTAFFVAYEDVQNLEVMNGLARYLGVASRLDSLDKKLKVQNPKPVTEKVENLLEMQEGLARLDRFNLARTPNFEPRRGPAVPSYVTAAQSPLLFSPVRGGPEAAARQWLAGVDGASVGALGSKHSQGDLRQWMRQNPGHRSFTVLRHPVARAHHVFCTRILNSGEGGFHGIRKTLIRRYKFALPENGPDASYDLVAHRAVFAEFLKFLNGNLSGQTAIRIDPEWASQVQVLQGFGEFILPDRLIREENAQDELDDLLRSMGIEPAYGQWPSLDEGHPFALDQIYDSEIEKLTRSAYGRDYVFLGFGNYA